MNPLLRLLGAAASHGLLTGQIVFSAAFVGACELPNWIHAPRQVIACRSPPEQSAAFRYSRSHCGYPGGGGQPGGALWMHFRCEPSLPVDGIGLFVLLPAPTL
jgi:hypothetical protein